MKKFFIFYFLAKLKIITQKVKIMIESASRALKLPYISQNYDLNTTEPTQKSSGLNEHFFKPSNELLKIPSAPLLRIFLNDRANEIETDSQSPKSGAYGTVTTHRIDGYEFVEKTMNDPIGDAPFAKDERSINRKISEFISKLETQPNPHTQVEYFLKLSTPFIAKYITSKSESVMALDKENRPIQGTNYRLFFEKAPGYIFGSLDWMSLEKISERLKMSESLKGAFWAENLRTTAQLFSALSVVHRAGIVHRDIKLSNIIFDPVGQNIKLIDFGISRNYSEKFIKSSEEPIGASYCGSLEEYELMKLHSENENRDEICDDWYNLNSPATDIYGMGMNLFTIFFREHGLYYIKKYFYEADHGNYTANVERRKIFYANLANSTRELNDKLPQNLRYSESQLNFITSLNMVCLDPDPTKRPSDAQACGLCELFSAGMEDFTSALKCVKELRPAKEPSKKLLDLYEKYEFAKKGSETPDSTSAKLTDMYLSESSDEED